MDFCYNLTGNVPIDRLMIALSWFGTGVFVPVGMTIFVATWALIFQKKHFALAIIVAPLVGNLVKSALKNLVARPRPGWQSCDSLVNLTDYSFPSGHTIFYTILFGLLVWYGGKFLWEKWYGKLLSILSAIMIIGVGLSRIYIGAHWATDVLAGYLIGAIILSATIYLLNRYPDA